MSAPRDPSAPTPHALTHALVIPCSTAQFKKKGAGYPRDSLDDGASLDDPRRWRRALLLPTAQRHRSGFSPCNTPRLRVRLRGLPARAARSASRICAKDALSFHPHKHQFQPLADVCTVLPYAFRSPRADLAAVAQLEISEAHSADVAQVDGGEHAGLRLLPPCNSHGQVSN